MTAIHILNATTFYTLVMEGDTDFANLHWSLVFVMTLGNKKFEGQVLTRVVGASHDVIVQPSFSGLSITWMKDHRTTTICELECGLGEYYNWSKYLLKHDDIVHADTASGKVWTIRGPDVVMNLLVYPNCTKVKEKVRFWAGPNDVRFLRGPHPLLDVMHANNI